MDIINCKNKLDTLLDPLENDMLLLLENLVNKDSFSSDGKDVNALGAHILAWLKDAGFYTSVLTKQDVPKDEAWQHDLGDVHMAKSHDSPEPGIGFIAHLDTVFPQGTAAMRPFRLDRANDRAYGAGVADMKAGIVANLFAARALKQLNIMPCPMTLMFSPDEELGSPTASKQLALHLKGAKAVMCAEPGGVGGGVTLSRKGSGHMHLKIEGISAHAGRCYADGASAILELAHKTLAINELLDLSASKTVNTGLITGGTSANSIAPWAESRIHITYRTLQEGEKLVQNIQKIVAKNYIANTKSTISGGIRLYPLERTKNGDALFTLAKDVGTHLGIDLQGFHYESAAESGFCSSVLNIPTLCCMGPEGDNIHTDQEFMLPSTLVQRSKLIALTALQAAHQI